MGQNSRRRFSIAGAATLYAPVISFAQAQQQGKVIVIDSREAEGKFERFSGPVD